MNGNGIEQAVNRRKGKAMAQILEVFEGELEPLLPAEKAKDYKALVRRKLNRLSDDVIDIVNAEMRGMASNGAAEALKDNLHPDGLPPRAEGVTT